MLTSKSGSISLFLTYIFLSTSEGLFLRNVVDTTRGEIAASWRIHLISPVHITQQIELYAVTLRAECNGK